MVAFSPLDVGHVANFNPHKTHERDSTLVPGIRELKTPKAVECILARIIKPLSGESQMRGLRDHATRSLPASPSQTDVDQMRDQAKHQECSGTAPTCSGQHAAQCHDKTRTGGQTRKMREPSRAASSAPFE
jgi:hypothetical protein